MPFPSPGDLPNTGIEPRSPASQADSLPAEPPHGKPKEALQITEERRDAKGKGERERYTQLNAEFQRIARRDKKAFLSVEGNKYGMYMIDKELAARTYVAPSPLAAE